jgi:hypothetical protein
VVVVVVVVLVLEVVEVEINLVVDLDVVDELIAEKIKFIYSDNFVMKGADFSSLARTIKLGYCPLSMIHF